MLVRRHLLCPLFATRFVSAFFFRARWGAAARRDGGLKGGGAVYAVSARGPAAAAAFRETFLQDASGSRRTAGASGLRGGWRRRMSALVLTVPRHLLEDCLATVHLTLLAFGSWSLCLILKLAPSVRTVVHLWQTRSRMAAVSALLPSKTLTQSLYPRLLVTTMLPDS